MDEKYAALTRGLDSAGVLKRLEEMALNNDGLYPVKLQLQAAKLLLDKTVPSLSHQKIEHQGTFNIVLGSPLLAAEQRIALEENRISAKVLNPGVVKPSE